MPKSNWVIKTNWEYLSNVKNRNSFSTISESVTSKVKKKAYLVSWVGLAFWLMDRTFWLHKEEHINNIKIYDDVVLSIFLVSIDKYLKSNYLVKKMCLVSHTWGFVTLQGRGGKVAVKREGIIHPALVVAEQHRKGISWAVKFQYVWPTSWVLLSSYFVPLRFVFCIQDFDFYSIYVLQWISTIE